MTTNNTYTFYEIVCKDENIEHLYVGSTKNFRNRKWQHKQCCENENNKSYDKQLYQLIRENGGWDNFEMKPLEVSECESITHARIREQE